MKTCQEWHHQRFESHESSVEAEGGEHRVVCCVQIACRHLDHCVAYVLLTSPVEITEMPSVESVILEVEAHLQLQML